MICEIIYLFTSSIVLYIYDNINTQETNIEKFEKIYYKDT